MKKGHWIAIIVLGFLSFFFMIVSFLLKQERESQIEISKELRIENEKLQDQLRRENLASELNALYNQHLIDSLKKETERK